MPARRQIAMEFAAHLPPQTDGSPAAAAPPPLPATSLPSLLAGIRDAPTAADLPSRLRALADAIRARSITVTKQEVIAACKAKRVAMGDAAWTQSVACKVGVKGLLAAFAGATGVEEVAPIEIGAPILVQWKPGGTMFLGRVAKYEGHILLCRRPAGSGQPTFNMAEGVEDGKDGEDTARMGKHRVDFVDGDSEWYDLSQTEHEVLAGEGSRPIGEAGIAGDIGSIVLALREGSGDIEVQRVGCAVLANLAYGNPAMKRDIAEAGGIELVLRALTLFPDEPDTSYAGCRKI